jgi:hypothetical protein
MGQGDKLVARSPEKAGVGGSTPSLATIIQTISVTSLPFFVIHITLQLKGSELLS